LSTGPNVLIGIATGVSKEHQRLHRAYVDAVVRAGGLPLLLPVVEELDSDLVSTLFDRLDGLLVPGGPGIVRNLEGELPDDLEEADPARARFDEVITSRFLEGEKPILGICYGMQLLNVLDGGRLFADVERQREGTSSHSHKRGASSHPIRVETRSLLHDALGACESEVVVNSRHIQAISTIGSSFRVTAFAPDGVIESIENADGLHLGVQFHPERMGAPMGGIFLSFIERARARAARTGRAR
jgi:putative glutamine amidotransferase